MLLDLEEEGELGSTLKKLVEEATARAVAKAAGPPSAGPPSTTAAACSNGDALASQSAGDALKVFKTPFSASAPLSSQTTGGEAGDDEYRGQSLGEILLPLLPLGCPLSIRHAHGSFLELVSSLPDHLKNGGHVLRIKDSTLMPSLHLDGGKGKDILSSLGHILIRGEDVGTGLDCCHCISNPLIAIELLSQLAEVRFCKRLEPSCNEAVDQMRKRQQPVAEGRGPWLP